ncbi:phospholipase [Granulicella sp. WH15]|uniref:alpha/beta hydrolase n=1 Tax=Granulicella sp. WH15 TaxID=2602070 RepID=UPI00136785DF|nr:dienelactone hydrolase family protein [Granulicella sp. WH15]QHN04686.1 phospholipase [Granulicella sp. WH15]
MAALASSPHAGAAVIQRGTPLASSRGALILLHGRGASAEDILGLGNELRLPDVTLLAPQAMGHTWYPNSFLAPIENNEPWLTSALALIQSIVQGCVDAGVSTERIAISGFSQGACLSSEFVARHPQRYAALIAFTGGLVGPLGSDLHHPGSLAGTPVLLSSGDPDPHVPWSRVLETAETLAGMGAVVETKRYAGRPHTVLHDEVRMAQYLLAPIFT